MNLAAVNRSLAGADAAENVRQSFLVCLEEVFPFPEKESALRLGLGKTHTRSLGIRCCLGGLEKRRFGAVPQWRLYRCLSSASDLARRREGQYELLAEIVLPGGVRRSRRECAIAAFTKAAKVRIRIDVLPNPRAVLFRRWRQLDGIVGRMFPEKNVIESTNRPISGVS
jgi:hypothetical protein